MPTTRFFPIARAPFQALLGAAFTLYACSFQDFDYLEKGPAANSGGGSGGGQSHTGGQAESGGTSSGGASGGSKSGQGGGSGASGAPAGGAGAGGEGEQGGEGGVAGGAGGAGGQGPGQGGAGGDGGAGGVPIGPEPMGNLLANPSFESNLTGWTVDPASATVTPTRYVYTQPASSGATTVDGVLELATWNLTDEYTVSISQIVKGLRPGTYSFKGNFSTLRVQSASLFARNCGGTDRMVVIPIGGFPWFEVAIPDIQVSTPTCEVGFSVHNVGDDWLNADMFTFEKVP